MNITDFTNIQERHGPLLAFRRETFARDISTAEAAELLLQSAQALQLTDRQSLYGNTLNDWLTGGKPPAWAIQGAIHWLEHNGWYPGIDLNQGNADTAKSATSDFAWWSYAKIKQHGDLSQAIAAIPTDWPADVVATAEQMLKLSWQVEEDKRAKWAEKRHQ
ncbi:hypothetical protein IBG34_23145 (plasmid) [Aeromonas media]|uniref:Uncharacterized protein n=1 Tax=Aeromonas caviae TaxID=648 RepID=A0A7D5YUY8_AERCA|nr:hypothetical protein [Aeromonas caviae]QLI60538.1 hypothetical protein C1C91_23520 [Aeromonas caviae]QYK83493.1 hypothetical protein IBG34_23145 [Aeromonas media]